MTDKELIESMQEAVDDLDSQIVNLPTCSIRTMLVAQSEYFKEFIQLCKADSIVRASYKKFFEECDRYEASGYSESHAAQFAWEACVDLGTMDHVASKMTDLEMFAKQTLDNGGEWWLLEQSESGALYKTQGAKICDGRNYFLHNAPTFQVFDAEGKRLYATTSYSSAYRYYESEVLGDGK